MKKVLLVHGFTGDGNGVWFPWLKRELENRGYEVFNPNLPDSRRPDLDAWLSAIGPFMEKLGSDDIIVAHSLGGKLALHAVLKYRKKIRKLILIAPAIGRRSESEWERRHQEWPGEEIRVLRRFYDAHIPLEHVAQFVETTAIFSDNDPYVPAPPREYFPNEWGYEVWYDLGHFLDSRIPGILHKAVN